MEKLKITEIIKLISLGKTFEAQTLDGALTIKINRYTPYICTAIHDGHQIRKELKDKIALNEYERWYEEDPHTGQFIKSLPITIVAHDSRFEYDLNRDPENCVYEEAWGKKVWKRKLTDRQKKISQQKHRNYYNILQVLIQQIESKFGGCVVYDLHTYNHKRWDREVPLFNVGTENVNQSKYRSVIDHWLKELGSIELNNVKNDTQENGVFFGRGYNLKFVTENFTNTIVLATEVKKVFCDEETGEIYPELIQEIQKKLKVAITNNALFYTNDYSTWNSKSSFNLLDKGDDPELLKVDKKLFNLLRNFELLAFVNPNNTRQEQKKYMRSKAKLNPKFTYAPIKIHPFELKRELSQVNLQKISDVNIRHMYEDAVNAHFDKIDMLGTLDSKKFLYNSLRYFGRPSNRDLNNANYLIHLPELPEEQIKAPLMDAKTCVDYFNKSLEDYKMECNVELSNKVIAEVMVLNSIQTVRVRPDAMFNKKEINGLIEHEIGVHMVTTKNSASQKLKIFNLGLPVNTRTQEGLAILSEYLSGSISIKRLKQLGLRVIMADMMCNGADFVECHDTLIEKYNQDPNEAFTMVTRIFRGGGFTKDYLYLKGFVDILNKWNNNENLDALLVGKTSHLYQDIIEEMIQREMVETPHFITKSFTDPKYDKINQIHKYILSGLK